MKGEEGLKGEMNARQSRGLRSRLRHRRWGSGLLNPALELKLLMQLHYWAG